MGRGNFKAQYTTEFLTEDDQWQNQRTNVQPAFYRQRLDTYVPERRATAAEMVEQWRDGAVAEANNAMTETTMDVPEADI